MNESEKRGKNNTAEQIIRNFLSLKICGLCLRVVSNQEGSFI
jgi:hypothetical protein